MTLRYLSPLHKAMRQATLHLDSAMRRLRVTPPEGHLLSYLLAYGPCPISELARVFGHKRSTLTSMLDRLEERALLARSTNPDDRRSFVVELEEPGKALAEQATELVGKLERRIDRRVAAADRRGFERVLTAIGEVTEVEVRPDRPTTEKEK